MVKKYNNKITILEFKKKIEETKSLGKEVKNKAPLLSEILARKDTFVEKRVVIEHIKKNDLIAFSNDLVRVYVTEKDNYIKAKILEILKDWLENKKLNKIPNALTEGLKANKKNYYYLFYLLSDFSPSLFANKVLKLLSNEKIESQNKIALQLLFERLANAHKVDLNYAYFSQNILKTTELLVATKNDLEWKDFLIDGVLEKKLHDTYLMASITAELFKYYAIPQEEHSRVFFLVDLLLELKFFAPAVDTIINSNIEEKDRIQLLLQTYNYLNSLNNLNIPNKDKLEEIQKKIFEFLGSRGVVPFVPTDNAQA